MKIYVISRSRNGIVRCLVRHTVGQGETLPAYRLPHANLHSPTGFECGYGGSGPADLAASILADFFDVPIRAVQRRYRGRRVRIELGFENADKVIGLHQDFKAEVICRIQIGRGQEHRISSDELVGWLCRKENEEKAAAEAAIEDPNKMPTFETDPE